MKPIRIIGQSMAIIGGLLSLGSVISILQTLGSGLSTWLWYRTPLTLLLIGMVIMVLGTFFVWLSTRLKE